MNKQDKHITKNILRVENLACCKQQAVLFSNLSLEITEGELLLIQGPNGSGKSSLLRLLVGLSQPLEGKIFWQNQSVPSLHYIGHQNGLKLGLTIIENIQFFSQLFGEINDDLSFVLSSLQLTKQQQIQIKYLSAGQKRRVALTKLFLFPKKLWVLDEPLTYLDQTTQTFFLEKLTTHLKNGGICILSSHQAINIPNISIINVRLGNDF